MAVEFDPHVRLLPSGALQNARHERLAILMGEGFDQNEAWNAVGGSTTSGGRRYGKKIFANKLFVGRVKVLQDEKAALEADPIWGEAQWMVNQLWRQACASQDIKVMGEAAKLRLTIAEKRSPEPAAPDEASTKGPGRPAAESTQTKGLPPDAIKAKLMQVGRKDSELDEDSEVEGEA